MAVFSCKTKIVSGPGALNALADLEIHRLFLVVDPHFVQSDTVDRMIGLTGATDIALFDQVEPELQAALAATGTAKVKEFQPDTIVALGGGSAIDYAKVITYFSGGNPTLVAIPTTSGSGSEVTDSVILTHNQMKRSLVDARLQPDYAILDSELLAKLPPALIAITGFDALTHAVEAMVARNASPMTDAFAKDAFSACFAALPASFDGDRSVRLKIHIAANMAGIAMNQAGLGLCHAISHALGGMFPIPHGQLNAILLPEVIACNAPYASRKYGALARAAGLGGSTDALAMENLRGSLIRLRRNLKLPGTLQEAGIEPRQIWRANDELVRAALDDPCCASNPMIPEDFMLRRILEAVTGRA